MWKEPIFLWNDLTIDWNDLTWNDLTMERNDRKSGLAISIAYPWQLKIHTTNVKSTLTPISCLNL